MNWTELEAAASEIARLGQERFDAARVALLATLRQDGWPRVSPVEPYLSEGHLLFGSLSWSAKTKDLACDPRCTLHSAVTGPDSGEGELKIYGRASLADDRLREGCAEGWWQAMSPEVAAVFRLDIERAAFTSWDAAAGRVVFRTWSPDGSYRETSRRYP
jgi:hypothetical protein